MDRLNKQQLTVFLGVSRVVADRLIAEGLPAEGEAGRQRFDPAAVARWLLAKAEAAGGGPGVERERERLLKAQADRAELELARARGELVNARAVHDAWASTFRTIRDLLRSFPRASAERLMATAQDGRAAFAAALLAEVDDALSRASRTPVVIDDDDAEAEDA